ncbi:MAG TPA: hypothetical protein VED01_17625 [Burkholderiales bacterium]|nr:hypothetical protein [Burkholderiales bacterium]
MISLVQISESAQGLVLTYPLWIAIALAAATAALVVFAVVRARKLKRRWPLSLAVVFAAWACVYVATYRMSVSEESGAAYAFLRFDHVVRWNDAADIYLEQHGGDWRIVVIDRARRAFAFDVAELSIDQRDRVMAYMVDRMPQSAFPRAPELLRRHAGPGPRPASFFSDQQI